MRRAFVGRTRNITVGDGAGERRVLLDGLADDLVDDPTEVGLVDEGDVDLFQASAALDDAEYVERLTRLNASGVDYLSRELRALGVEVWPTDANFVLARAGEGTYDRLLREGVIVRPLVGFGMPDHVRISVGLPEENERLVKPLRRIREGGV